MNDGWTVKITGKARKQIKRLSERNRLVLELLVREIELDGPVRTNWPNYGKLKGREGYHHCHLNKGRPRYVAVWMESGQGLKLVEVRYVGTHEKADYSRIY